MPSEETCANCHRLIGALEEAFVWKDNIVCSECYKKLSVAARPIEPNKVTLLYNINFILTAIAAFVIVVGAFLPVVKVPIIGSMNYFRNGQGDGVFVIILALIAVLLILNGKRLLNLVPAVLITIILSYFLYNIRHSVAEMKQVADDNIFAGLAAAMADTVQIRFGWFLMLFGNVILYVAICIKPKALFEGQVPWWNRISIGVLIVIGILVFFNQGNTVNRTFSRDNSVVSEQSSQRLVSVKGKGYPKQIAINTIDEIGIIENPFFGVYLGEMLADLQDQYNVELAENNTEKYLNRYQVFTGSEQVKYLFVYIFQNRVERISVGLRDDSQTNYEAVKKEIEAKYEVESSGISSDHFDIRVSGEAVSVYLHKPIFGDGLT